MAFRTEGVHHVGVTVSDLQRSLEWYSRYWPTGKRTNYAGFPAFSDERLAAVRWGHDSRDGFSRTFGSRRFRF